MLAAFDARDAADPRARGWGRYARELLDALRSQDGVEVHAFTSGVRGLPEAVFEQVALPFALWRRVRADVVHAPNCFLPLVRPCAGVVTVHDLAWERFPDDFEPRTRLKYAQLVPRAVRSAERVIVPSAATRDDVLERYGRPGLEERVRVVPYAPSLAAGDAPVPAGAPYLLGVGDLRIKKNWGVAVEALRSLQTGHRLLLAGVDGGAGGGLRTQARGLPVELLGWVDERRLDALLRGAAVLVHPSRHEGFGLVVVEAQARGVPVCVARGSSLEEAAGGACVPFDPDDPVDCARAVTEALARREELAAAGRAWTATLSWARVAGETAAVYAEAAAAR